MDNQDLTKQRKEQADSDFAINNLQEQETALSVLATIESETEDEDEEEEISQGNYNYYGYFQGYDFEDGLGFLDSDYSDEDMDDIEEEDEIDPDELSYEELIALAEFVGVEKRGFSLNQISNCLRSSKFGPEVGGIIDRCVVCQVEYEEEEPLVALPCEHPFHSDCISKWLQIKKVCPICATEPSSSPPDI